MVFVFLFLLSFFRCKIKYVAASKPTKRIRVSHDAAAFHLPFFFVVSSFLNIAIPPLLVFFSSPPTHTPQLPSTPPLSPGTPPHPPPQLHYYFFSFKLSDSLPEQFNPREAGTTRALLPLPPPLQLVLSLSSRYLHCRPPLLPSPSPTPNLPSRESIVKTVSLPPPPSILLFRTASS